MSTENNRKLKIFRSLGLSDNEIKKMVFNIWLSRGLDDMEVTMKKQSKAFFQISGAGHEGVLTAAGMVFRPSYDYFLCYYRDRALCLALGVTPVEMLCQANGNIGDTASYGRQMPAHWGNKKLNIVNKSSCTGTQFLQAVGLAESGRYLSQLTKQLKKKKIKTPSFHDDEIVLVTTGDGTTSQGEFWEALTTSVVNKLPVAFLVEDNGYAISVPVSEQIPLGSISKTLKNFPNLKIFECDGNCPLESLVVLRQAEQYLRKGQGPALIHAHVTRPYSHSLSDDHRNYRDHRELLIETKKDVVATFPEFLFEAKILTKKQLADIKSKVDLEIRSAHQKALEFPWPRPETFADHLYAEELGPTSDSFAENETPSLEGDELPMAAAINLTLKSELEKNPLMRIFGEDVADFSDEGKLQSELKGKGGVFKVTAGLQRNSLKGQVFNSPLAEANIVGRAIGQAIRGLKPVVEIQFFDYIWTAFMQLKNEMATLRYRSGGDYSCPIVVRVPIGGYLKGGSIYHSQSGESFFAHIPGLRVAFPSNSLDAVGLLRTAIRCQDPVLFLEHKHLYYQGYNRRSYPGDEFCIPFGKAKKVKEGQDLSLFCWGALVQKSLEAVKLVEKSRGQTIEVIDLRTLAPFDRDSLAQSVKKTNRALIVHEENLTCGLGAEIAAFLTDECFEHLDAPIRRLASKDTHVAYCPGLEEVILPQIVDVQREIERILDY